MQLTTQPIFDTADVRAADKSSSGNNRGKATESLRSVRDVDRTHPMHLRPRAMLRLVIFRRDSLRAAAPKEWQTAQTSVARLFRRLSVAVEAADASVKDLQKADVAHDRLDEAASELRTHVVSMIRHLVVVSRLPLVKRQRALRPIRNQVDDVEWLSARIGVSAIEARGSGAVDVGLAEITDRLTSLERARSSLDGA